MSANLSSRLARLEKQGGYDPLDDLSDEELETALKILREVIDDGEVHVADPTELSAAELDKVALCDLVRAINMEAKQSTSQRSQKLFAATRMTARSV